MGTIQYTYIFTSTVNTIIRAKILFCCQDGVQRLVKVLEKLRQPEMSEGLQKGRLAEYSGS